MLNESKKEYLVEEPVVIDGKESVISCKISFNTIKGTVSISPRMTTKQFSFNPAQMEGAKNAAKKVLDQAYQKGLELLKEWVEEQRPGTDPAQMNIFDIINGKGVELEEEEDGYFPLEDEEPVKKRGGRAKKIKEILEEGI